VVTDDGPMLDQVQALYDHLWRGGECAKCKLREECPKPLDGKAKIASKPVRLPKRPTRP
jgi:hypothetical protein